MDLIEIQRHLKIVELSSELLNYIDEGDCSHHVKELLAQSSNYVKDANATELSVYNPTLVEIGKFESSVKIIMLTRYGLFKHQIKKKKKKKRKALIKACNNTRLPDDLMNKTMLFRRYPKSLTDSVIGIQIKESIKNEIIKAFEDKNKELILKL